MERIANKDPAAALLYEQVGVTVSKLRPFPRQHKGTVVFCGYADIHLWLFPGHDLEPLHLLTLVGNSIKLIGEQIHFDPKSERGKGDRSGNYFPHWYPATKSMRSVLTRKISDLPEIQEMARQAIEQLSADSSPSA